MSPKPHPMLPGLGPRTSVPRVVPGVDWKNLPLDTNHGFVLSRVDGRTTLGNIVLLVPFPENETVAILTYLYGSGLIEIPGLPRMRLSVTTVPVGTPYAAAPSFEPPPQQTPSPVPPIERAPAMHTPPPPSRPVPQQPPPAATSAPRGTYSMRSPRGADAPSGRHSRVTPPPMAAVPRPSPEPVRPPPSDPAPSPPPRATQYTPPAMAPPRAPQVTPQLLAERAPQHTPPAMAAPPTASSASTAPVRQTQPPPSAPRTTTPPPVNAPQHPTPRPQAQGSGAAMGAEDIDLPVEVRLRIDEMVVRSAQGNPFLLLDVSTGVDKKELRRAYFRLSKEFHPDRYFGRKLGSYQRLLQQVFASLSSAFELLSDDERRAEEEARLESQ
ncbi:MAG: hypothetical protein EXR72_03365 [Myxococcales bacterium]|nr:hypothetical protein [Myxococcales bacterium]